MAHGTEERYKSGCRCVECRRHHGMLLSKRARLYKLRREQERIIEQRRRIDAITAPYRAPMKVHIHGIGDVEI